MPKNINDNIFNVSSKNNTCKLIAKNTLAILFITVISNQLKISKENIIKEVKKAIIYNTLCSTTYLKNITDENKECIKSYNKLEYVAGTSHIDNMCKTILESDSMKIFNITKKQFEKLLNECLNSCLNEKEIKNKESSRKRRTLNLFDKILVSNFYNKKMSNFYLTGDYSIEHISPFSSRWEENTSLDIDRLGNLFPTLDSLNRSRQNTNLEIYYKPEYINFTKNIDELLPKNYDTINSYKDRKTTIIDTNKYNEYCNINEKLYIKTLVDDLYSL
jgi:hypothetical protein